MAKQVIYRRGTTAEHANFVGANGEITVDTVKHVVIVHDGVTAGGFPLANASTITANISALTANAANQAAAITVLQANAATQSANIATLFANAVAQQANITAFTLASNSTVIFANISGVRANVEAANVQISLLYGNATIQSESITAANANITALQANIAAANVAIAGIVTGTAFVTQTAFANNLTAVNSAVSTQGVTFATNVAVAGIRANVTAANVEISRLQANIAAANVAINNIALSPSLINSIAQTVGPIVTNGTFYSNANTASYLADYDGSINFTSSTAIISNVDAITVGDHIQSPAYQFSNGVNILSTVSGTYANGNVASYLPTYSGNVRANYVQVSSGIIPASFASSPAPFISGFSSISAENFKFLANGVNILTTMAGTYSNANVAAYLTRGTSPYAGITLAGNVYAGPVTGSAAEAGFRPLTVTDLPNLSANISSYLSSNSSTNISTTGNVYVGGTLYVLGNVTQMNYEIVNNTEIANAISATGNVSTTANIIAPNYLVTGAGSIGQYTGGGFVGIKMVANSALGQNVAIMGTGNITFPILNYVGTTLYGATIGTWGGDWNFSSDTGALTLPNGAVIRDTAGDAVAFGENAGLTSQGASAVAIGAQAGNSDQGIETVAIGGLAGFSVQGQSAVAVGFGAGYTLQGVNSVAIGKQAGLGSQGDNAISIGYRAGDNNQGNNSIIINATGSILNQTTANTFTVAPVRNDVANTAQVLFYNTTSKEITYGNTISIAGNLNVNGTGSALSRITVYGSASANASLGMYNSINDIGAQIYLGDNNFNSSTKWNSAPGIGATYDSSYGGLAGALGLYTYAGNDNSRALRVTVDAQQGGVQVHSNADSYSTTTGALKVGGGVGIGGNLHVSGNIVQQSAYYETYSNVTNSGGNLTCNFANSATFYATLTANVTVNFTNVVATAGRVTGATLIVDQGATAYRVANIQINSGGIQTVKYAGGTPNTGTASNTDVMSFSLISLDGTSWRVLGQISNYG